MVVVAIAAAINCGGECGGDRGGDCGGTMTCRDDCGGINCVIVAGCHEGGPAKVAVVSAVSAAVIAAIDCGDGDLQ